MASVRAVTLQSTRTCPPNAPGGYRVAGSPMPPFAGAPRSQCRRSIISDVVHFAVALDVLKARDVRHAVPRKVQVVAEEEGHIDQSQHDRNLHQWADDAGERLPGLGGVHADGHRQRQLEVVAGGGKGHGGAFPVVRAQSPRQQEGAAEHEEEVEQEGARHPEHNQRGPDDGDTLHREHDDDGEEQRNESDGADALAVLVVVRVIAHVLSQEDPGQQPHDEGDAEVDQDGDQGGDEGFAQADPSCIDVPFGESEGREEHVAEQRGVHCVEGDLQDAVHGDQHGAQVVVPS
mmetsp:Transcript_85804/g.142855  ORF Transcript_85804/g.142855 Transcript_85804/m.142855 type:complete len:290 (+) Transcript_85804:1632-2501(+)